MVGLHVGHTCDRVVAAGCDVVVGDALHRHLLGRHPGAGNHALDLVATTLEMPPGGHLVTVARGLHPGTLDQGHLPLGGDVDARRPLDVGGGQPAGPHVCRFDDVVVDADDAGDDAHVMLHSFGADGGFEPAAVQASMRAMIFSTSVFSFAPRGQPA